MKLVKTSDFGIEGINYYWQNRNKFNLTKAELLKIGLSGNYAEVDENLIRLLQQADKIFRQYGYQMYIKDGYRSQALYKLIQRKRYEKDGIKNTDKTFNPFDMPHTSGLVVDVSLKDLKHGKEVKMWDKNDWPDGIFIDFYKDRKDGASKRFQKLQVLLRHVMLSVGFKLGKMKEFWHFSYQKEGEISE